VIETRRFHPVGETNTREFRGKLIAATNRDLAAGIRKGTFREDLYYRLCSDLIATPSLAEQIADAPQVLPDLILYMTRRVAGPGADELAAEMVGWIEKHLGPRYPWPGNYREVEQCVKNFLIRRDYRPAGGTSAGGAVEEILDDVRHCRLSVDELMSRYVTLAYAAEGRNYDRVARRIGIDRRTVKSRVDVGLLAKI
jgi:transcriptional regulator with PAS, ATPase and Fis domain